MNRPGRSSAGSDGAGVGSGEALFEASGDREVFGFMPLGSTLATAGR